MNYIVSDSNIMGTNPASINLGTGIITINKDVWQQFSDVQKKLIYLHELAHYRLNTVDDEIACDKWAIEQYAGSEKKSLRKAVNAYASLLDKDYIPEERKRHILISCLTIDHEKFGNKQALALLKEIQSKDEKKAKIVGVDDAAIISAIVAVAGLAIQAGNNFIWSKKNEWAKESGTGKTATRERLLHSVCQVAVCEIVREKAYTYGVDGLDMYFIDNRRAVQERVFSVMVTNGLFTDGNIATVNWKRYQEFIKKYSWVPTEIDKYVDEIWTEIKKQQGYTSSAGTTSYLVWIVAAIVGFFLIKKVLL
ncbi:hypothetical protein FACS1894153_0380 [Bacteroidia bacterium]|nr:hypothetical protein FACS1894153_0380 [Bacteroidia bacterium]